MSGVTEGFGVDAAAAMRLMNLMMDAVPGEARFLAAAMRGDARGGEATAVATRAPYAALVDAFLAAS